MESRTCRLCDSKTSTGFKVFGKRGRQLNIQPIILQHFTLEFTDNDGLSNYICRKCWRTTNNFHKLYCNVLDKLDGLTEKCVENNEIKVEDLAYEQTADEKVSEFVSIVGNLETVLKSEELLKTDDGIDVDTQSTSYDIPQPLQTKRNSILTNLKEAAGNHDLELNTVDRKIANRKRFTDQNTEISNFLGMKCEICLFPTETFSELKRHIKLEHQKAGYLRCCKRKYYRQNLLYNHIINHRFPNKYMCDVCDKSFLDKYCLTEHKKTHDPSRRKLLCPHCPKRFEYKSFLDLHIRRCHVDEVARKTCVCDICKKCFSTKYAVAAHLYNVHADKSNHICDVCAKVFKKRGQLDHHYQINHTGIKKEKIQCTICGVWLTDNYGLRKHMRRHEGTEQACTLCGKIFTNRVSLTSHMRHVHSNKQYQCSICDKVFKSRIVLREHLSVHTGCTLYKCPYCTMEFKTGSNMYKHRKNSHPAEWARDQGKHIDTKLNTPNNYLICN